MRVTVVGGGVVGLSVAWRAAERGMTVTVVDPEPGRGASWVAAGMLAPVTEVHYGEEPLLALNLEAARAYPSFVADVERATGRDCGYQACGTLAVARDTDDNAALEELYRYQRSLALAVERLGSRDCRRLEPGLSTRIRGGLLVAGDHQIDPRRLVAALHDACRRRGVSFRNARATRIDAPVVMLEDDAGVDGDVVVLAAGSWSGTIDGLPDGSAPPVRPVKGQVLRLRGRADEVPAGRVVRGLDVYVVPRADGEVVVGATSEERGFDTTVTAGAVYELLRDAYELLPGITELELVETAAGLRPGTPDNAPLLGESAVAGLVLATGHYRNGILLVPVTGDAIAELLDTGTTPTAIAPFSPQRVYAEVPG